MSNHFTGLSLGPPLGDQRLDLCDLYAFQSPVGPASEPIHDRERWIAQFIHLVGHTDTLGEFPYVGTPH